VLVVRHALGLFRTGPAAAEKDTAIVLPALRVAIHPAVVMWTGASAWCVE
jgi:hypothetical protein